MSLLRFLADLPWPWRADPLRPDRLPGFAQLARAAMPAEELTAIRRISMIDETTLATLRALAGLARGAALEIGPYMGGSTVAIAGGLPPGGRLATIEVGGSHVGQPYLPTDDILGSLARNLAEHGLADRVTTIIGKSYDPAARDAVDTWLRGGRIGFFFMDADQYPERNLLHFARDFTPGCIVAIDDYFTEDASDKGRAVHAFVDLLVAEGALREAGVLHCTWFGRVKGMAGLAKLAALRRPRFVADRGCAWIAEPRLDVTADYLLMPDGSSPAAPIGLDWARRAQIEAAMLATVPTVPQVMTVSPLVVLEDGRPLAQPHALHAEIREQGQGRYSHWTYRAGADRNGATYREVLFSTSDNSDPNSNGRRYTAKAGAVEVPLCGI
jgi:predicted O-methyltransferase YrrM